MSRQEILLESGTNEVELMEFYLAEQSFAINVAKVEAVVQFEPEKVTTMPDVPPSILGVYLHRDMCLPFVDLSAELGIKSKTAVARKIVMISEFNGVMNAFLIDGVERIHRISWDEIVPMGHIISSHKARMTGSFHIEERDILIVDMETVIADIFPETAMKELDTSSLKTQDRSNRRISIVEDSAMMRSLVLKILNEAGYQQVSVYSGGQEGWDAILALTTNDSAKLPHLVISDIEMPRMDGLTLCRKVKEHSALKNIPVVMFSSLINDQMSEKCKSVGADGQITKPESGKLVDLVDQLCLKA